MPSTMNNLEKFCHCFSNINIISKGKQCTTKYSLYIIISLQYFHNIFTLAALKKRKDIPTKIDTKQNV